MSNPDESSTDTGPAGGAVPDGARGVYPISVVAELTGISAATLRLYERRGVLTPARTEGGTRRYSADDLARLRRITDLLDDGVNLAGITAILDLQDDNQRLQDHNDTLTTDNDRLHTDNTRLRHAARPQPAPRSHR